MTDKVEWPEHQLDYSDSYTIKITKVNFDGEFTHWESEYFTKDGEFWGSSTAPTFVGVLDSALEYLYDYNYEWTRDDANSRVRDAGDTVPL